MGQSCLVNEYVHQASRPEYTDLAVAVDGHQRETQQPFLLCGALSPYYVDIIGIGWAESPLSLVGR